MFTDTAPPAAELRANTQEYLTRHSGFSQKYVSPLVTAGATVSCNTLQ